MLKLAYEWLVIPPATGLAYLILFPIVFIPLVATSASWYCIVRLLDGATNGSPRRLKTGLIAGAISGYVLLVTGTAVIRFPHVVYEELVRGSD
jgi:hypothetical protein